MRHDNGSAEIKAIDKKTVNKICSGQVVLSLATAVKELLENSLDAGATSVRIHLKEYGSESLEVTDNGCGVEEGNFEGLTLKHYTSKISEFNDVASVETFGFRGEALSSLCALASVSVHTRHVNTDVGTLLRMDHHGHIFEKTPVARQVGTTVTVENLFSTLPVRYKEFQRNIKKEFGKMCNVLYAYALINSHCSITCTNRVAGRSRPIMETKAGLIRNNIIAIFGTKQNLSLLEVKTIPPNEDTLLEFRFMKSKGSDITISGFVSSCMHGSGRSSPDRQFYYINKRPVDHSKISRLVNEIYHQYNPHQSPFVYLDIRVLDGCVDVNVVPDKRQILLEHEGFLLATIKASLTSLYSNVPAILPIQLARAQPLENLPAGSDSIVGLRRYLAPGASTTEPSGNVKVKQTALSRFLIKRDADSQKVVSNNEKAATHTLDHPVKKMKLEIFIEPMCANHAVEDTDNSIINSYVPISRVQSDKSDSLELNIHKIDTSAVNIEGEEQVENLGSVRLETDSDILMNAETILIKGVSEFSSQDACGRNIDSHIIKQIDSNIEGEIPVVIVTEEKEKYSVDEGLSEGTKKTRKYIVHDISVQAINSSRVRRNICGQNLKVKFFAKIEPSSNDRAEEELRRELSQTAFMKMKILGQFNRGFIITQLDSDLFIIDQHATDEKFNFEKLSTEPIKNQRLTVPQTLRLTAANEEILQSRIEVFQANGFDFDIDTSAESTTRVRLTTVPVTQGITLGSKDVDELLFMLDDAPAGQMCRPSRVRDILASRACRKSVMVGTSLNSIQMRRLVHHMAEMIQPWNCPHGRPTIRHLLSLDLINEPTL